MNPLRVGTDLRGPDGHYSFPQGEGYEPQKLLGLTTVIGLVKGGSDFAAGTWTAQEAQRLYEASKSAQTVFRYRGCEYAGDGRWERLYDEVDAGGLLSDPDHLRLFHVAELSRCADRGTVLHELARYYSLEDSYPLADADVRYWVSDRIAQGDGNQAYRCDEYETTAYCVSLNQWIREQSVRILRSEFAAYHSRLGYACTIDALCAIGDGQKLGMVDFKSRGSSSRSDAWQLAAQWHCDRLIVDWDKSVPARHLLGMFEPMSILVTPESVSVRRLGDSLKTAWKEFRLILNLYRSLETTGGATKSGAGVSGVFDTDKSLGHRTAYKEAKSA